MLTHHSATTLPRRARLTDPAAFTKVFSNPTKSSDRYFTVLAAANGLAYSRLGLAISRKVARSAVVRNAIKRGVRESFRHHQAQLSGLDVVVIGRAAVATTDYAQRSASLARHWRRLAPPCAAS